MRGATQCARRLKSLFRRLRAGAGRAQRPTVGEPIAQMILGVLSRDAPESKARAALDRVRGMVVDYNELRVIPALELSNHLGDYPDARLKSEDLSRALNGVFAIEHTLDLSGLAGTSRKELCAYLERIDGLEAYTRARMRLLGFSQHAIPLDEAMWAYARQTSVIDGHCPLEEAQSFLERRIPESDGLEFVALLKKKAWAELGAAVRKREVERIRSVPPDRTSRNMLQVAAAAAAGGSRPPPALPEASADAPVKAPAAEEPKPAPAKPAKRSAAARPKRKVKTKARSAKGRGGPRTRVKGRPKAKVTRSARARKTGRRAPSRTRAKSA